MISIPEHITETLERLGCGKPGWWSVSRSGLTWSARAEWPGGQAQLVGRASMDDALQALLGRLFELEDELVLETRNAPFSAHRLPELNPVAVARIACVVDRIDTHLSNRP